MKSRVCIFVYMTPSNAQELAKAIMEAIIETELKIPADQRIDSELVRYIQQQVDVRADKIWMDNILNRRDTLAPTRQDLEEIWKRAGEAYTEDLFNGLVDKGMIGAVISESGDILYKVTEEGKKAVGIDEEAPAKKRKPKKKP